MAPNDPNEFDIPEGYNEGIGNPLDNEGVRLPFLAPMVWWQNGRPIFKDRGGAPYFGGWAMNDVDMSALHDQTDTLPLNWLSYDLVNEQGEDYTAFMTRWAYFAIIGTRNRWIQEVNKGHYQVLAYMAYQGADKSIVPYSPVVLTCKGTAGMFLRQAVIKFSTQTAAARKKFAKDLPISAFFATLGTFGQAPEYQSVGKEEGKKKNVTPVNLWLPEKIDGAYLHAAYVGREIAELSIGLRKDAADWLADWKQPQKQQRKQEQANPGEEEYVPDPMNEPPQPDDVSPF